jgi:hypothetical protein
MKKILSIVLFIQCTAFISYSQDTTGLIAHWKMNGNGLDATGHGHNGRLHHVSPVLGRDGIGDTAFYFAGRVDTPCFISVPYSPDLNLNNFSLCGIVKVQGFYSGVCQANTIITRGSYTGSPSSGYYQLYFTDNQSDGNNCSAFDSTKMCFQAHCSNNNHAHYTTEAPYTPTISENVWYSIVVTFDDTNYRVYVDGVLKSTASVTSPGTPIGNSTDSLVIGFDTWELPTYPYPFKGIIDDIRLYNRVLDSNEVLTYDTTSLKEPTPIDTDTTNYTYIYNNEPAINVFPNPAHTSIELTVSPKQMGTLQIINELGQLLKEEEITDTKNVIDINGLPIGMYILKLQLEGQTIFRKLIKE